MMWTGTRSPRRSADAGRLLDRAVAPTAGRYSAPRHRQSRSLPRRLATGRRPQRGVRSIGAMTRWEYATVPLIVHATKQILDQWGDDGWELVQVEIGRASCRERAGVRATT